ncbi:hypothetical protein JMUB6875_14120 [Nocardia sp. JMUB6875]|uniref:GAF and ANTAR domain-containing protein n=1 Tax=Nocardia sp. JMUB6875 TaxID=3158170 RepID=UPI0032E69702
MLSAEIRDLITAELREYHRELSSAARAAALAEKYEREFERRPESMRPFRERMAALNRRMEHRHRACAQLHRSYALRLRRWAEQGTPEPRPGFMTAVAEELRMDSAVITLFDDDLHELLVICSDATARAAHDLEEVVGTGPARDIALGGNGLLVSGCGLVERWPEFGSAAVDLGIRTLVAVALRAESRRIGALCAFSPQTVSATETVAIADSVADALANVVLLTAAVSTRNTVRGALFEDADFRTEVHRAVGVVAVQCACDSETALTLLRARAFAESVPLTHIARQVLEGTCRLC